MTTYRKSQKALNVRRNAKVALSAESGVTLPAPEGRGFNSNIIANPAEA